MRQLGVALLAQYLGLLVFADCSGRPCRSPKGDACCGICGLSGDQADLGDLGILAITPTDLHLMESSEWTWLLGQARAGTSFSLLWIVNVVPVVGCRRGATPESLGSLLAVAAIMTSPLSILGLLVVRWGSKVLGLSTRADKSLCLQ